MRLLLRVLGQHLSDVRAVATGARDDRAAGLGIGAQVAVTCRLREELLGALERQLVGGELFGDARALAVPLEVRPVAADAQHDSVCDLEGVDLARVDRAEIRDELVQTTVAVAEVEAAEPFDAMLVPGRDPVEVVLHPRGEVVVDEPAEMLLEQGDDGEREERRYERRAALEDVAAVEDRAEDRGIRRRPADAELLERPHERRLGVAGRRARLMPLWLERA